MLPKVDFPKRLEGDQQRLYNLVQIFIAKLQGGEGRMDDLLKRYVEDRRAELFALFIRGKWAELFAALDEMITEDAREKLKEIQK